MTATYLGIYLPGTPEWYEMRSDRVGGSDLAAILGLSPWQSPFSLWHQKRGDTEPDIQEKPQLEWGTRLEPVIVQAWGEKHPEYIVGHRPGATYAHPEYQWATVAPDALVYDGGTEPVTGLEAKTSRYDYSWIDGVPPYYEVQGQWAMFVHDLPTWNFAVLFGGSDFREYTVEANPALQAILREEASDFLDSLATDRVPALDGHDSTYQAVRELHPDLTDDEVEVGDVGRIWIEATRTAAAANEAKAEATTILADLLGNGRRALMDGQRIAYRQNSKTNPYLKAVPGLLTKFPESAAS